MKDLVQKAKELIQRLCLNVKAEWPSFKRLVELLARLATKKIPNEEIPAAKAESLALLSQTKTILTLSGVCVLVVFWMMLRGCGGSSSLSQCDSQRDDGGYSERMTPAALAEKLAACYHPSQNNLLFVLHSGSRMKPEKGVAYWGSLNHVKFTGCDSFDVFTAKDDIRNIYYDFCVVSKHHYVDHERLQDGFYVYIGDQEYETVSGSTRRLYCFRELDEATTIELNKILEKRREEERVREKEERRRQQKEAQENARRRVKAVEDFLDEYVGEKLWEAPRRRAKGDVVKEGEGFRIVKLKKKFRYCDMAKICFDRTNKNKITRIMLCCVLDAKYENEAILKEYRMILKVLDERFGVGKGITWNWGEKHEVEDTYTYWICDTDSGILDPSWKGEPKEVIGVMFERDGEPPRDDVRKELPPL